MKIQCPCGTKYAFDVTPEMAQTPIQFVCQNCGLDSSDVVNELIRRELISAPPVAVAPPPSPVVAPSPPPVVTAPPSTGTSRVRIQAVKATEPSSGDTTAAHLCPKHPGQMTTHLCLVCQKPICPKCMEYFGYVCSPLCKSKAEAQGIAVPTYGRQKAVVAARHWRKVGLISGAIGAVVVGLLGLWFWYAWFGSVPSPVFSVRFDQAVSSGQSIRCETNQIVFLHGVVLSRQDIKAKNEVWSQTLIDKKQVYDAVLQMYAEEQDREEGVKKERPREVPKILYWDKILERMQQTAEGSLQLHVRGQNVWVRQPVALRSNDWKLVRYDWNTGKPVQELLLGSMLPRLMAQGDDLLLTQYGRQGRQAVVHINLRNGEWRVDKFSLLPEVETRSSSGKKSEDRPAGTASKSQAMAGLPPGTPGKDRGKPLDPAKVAQQVQNLPLPNRIALPATLSSELHQERILAELDDEPAVPARSRGVPEPANPFTLIPCPDGYVQMAVRLLEAKFVSRTAMKAPPAKSALDGNLTVDKTADVANEILNEMQRSRGGDTVTEDQSRYQVTVRRPDAKGVPDWTGEVIGSPSLLPLKTVSVVTAGKMLVVLDKTNQKLWQGTLSYEVVGGSRGFDEENVQYGQGPCVERGDALYVFDQAVLTAFDLKTGNVRWRLPSVGVEGLFFDDQGMMYVNTTTASPERIKYSRQIDVRDKTSAIVSKVNPQTGKILWTADPGGYIAYVSGKFIYTLQSHDSHSTGEENPYATGLEPPSHVVIRRLNPASGRAMWVHTQKRAPLDVRFDGNTIELVFKKEVQVLSFLTL